MQWAQPDSRRLEFWRPGVSNLVKQQETMKNENTRQEKSYPRADNDRVLTSVFKNTGSQFSITLG